jgi:hypothetical protein
LCSFPIIPGWQQGATGIKSRKIERQGKKQEGVEVGDERGDAAIKGGEYVYLVGIELELADDLDGNEAIHLCVVSLVDVAECTTRK